ncbi:MAG: DNA repair protein RecO [Clostridia bacterium]|nr:DNA repair protein RecO [Clostridia bacterium]
MEERQLCGVCLGSRAWKESDRMLSVFCQDGNVYDVLARGAAKPKYKLKFAAQLFSYGDYFLTPSKAGYYILGGAVFGELSFLHIAQDPDAYAAACFVCEVAKTCVRAENKRMYAETVAALGELASDENVRCDLICLRILLAAFATSGYGFTFGNDPKGKACAAVLNAPAGAVSSAEANGELVRGMIRPLSVRFANRFDKLQSVGFLPFL